MVIHASLVVRAVEEGRRMKAEGRKFIFLPNCPGDFYLSG
jgi:hypothetical protein